MRHREKANSSEPQYLNWDQWWDGQPNGSGVLMTGYDEELDTMDDEVTPHFHMRSRRGEIINSPCYQYYKQVTRGSGSRSAQHKTVPNTGSIWSGDVTGLLAGGDAVGSIGIDLPFHADIPVRRQNAIVAALSNIDPAGFEFGEDILEIHKSAALLRRPIGTARDVLDQLRKDFIKRRNRGVAIAQASADAWLKYRFVYGTTVRSIAHLLEAHVAPERITPQRRTARSYYDDGYQKNDLVTKNGRTYERTMSIQVRGRVAILYQGGSDVSDWQTKYGLRLKDVPKALWAVAPYSWLTDRLVNISNFTGAVVNLLDPRVSILCSSYTESIESTYTIKIVAESSDDWNIALSGNTITTVERRKKRVPMAASDLSPIPALYSFAPKGIGATGDFFQTADEVAILVKLTQNVFSKH